MLSFLHHGPFSISIRMDNSLRISYSDVLSTFALYKGAFFLRVSTRTCPKLIFFVVKQLNSSLISD